MRLLNVKEQLSKEVFGSCSCQLQSSKRIHELTCRLVSSLNRKQVGISAWIFNFNPVKSHNVLYAVPYIKGPAMRNTVSLVPALHGYPAFLAFLIGGMDTVDTAGNMVADPSVVVVSEQPGCTPLVPAYMVWRYISALKHVDSSSSRTHNSHHRKAQPQLYIFLPMHQSRGQHCSRLQQC